MNALKTTPLRKKQAIVNKVFGVAVFLSVAWCIAVLWLIFQQKQDWGAQLERQGLEKAALEFALQLEKKSTDYAGYLLNLREQLSQNPLLEQNQLIAQTLTHSKLNLDFSSVRNIRIVQSRRCNPVADSTANASQLQFFPIHVYHYSDVLTLETDLGSSCEGAMKGIAMDIAMPELFREVQLELGLRGVAFEAYSALHADSLSAQQSKPLDSYELQATVFDLPYKFVFYPDETHATPLFSQSWSTRLCYFLMACAAVGFIVLALRLRKYCWRLIQRQEQSAMQLDRALHRRDLLQRFSQQALLVVDVNSGKIIETSHFYAQLLGYSEQELKRLNFSAIVADDAINLDVLRLPDTYAKPLCHSADSQKDGRIFCRKIRHVHKSGKPIEVALLGIRDWPADMYDRDPIDEGQACLLIATDLQVQSHLENAIGRIKSRHHYILDHIPVGICLVDSGLAIDYMNVHFLRISGVIESAGITQFNDWWASVVKDAQKRHVVQARWGEICEQAQASDADTEMECMEFTVEQPNGQEKTLELAGMAHDSGFVFTLVDISCYKKDQEQVRNLAFYDSLTGLPNEKLLLDRLEQAMMTGAKHHWYGAVMTIDLDGFRIFNDTVGYACGDELLRLVAKRLRASVPLEFTLARIVDDEFVIVMTSLSENADEAANLCKQLSFQILDSMRAPFEIADKFYKASLCMGAAVFKGDEVYARELLRRSDIALAQAKSSESNALQFFDPAMQATAKARAALESDIRAGMALGQFVLYFQPQLEGNKVIGAEALLRWRNGDKGFVSPTSFISTAEESNLILPLGNWVLQQACRQLSLWAQSTKTRHLTLSINVSPRQFKQEGFVQQVISALASTGAPASQLKLEITESVLFDNIELSIQTMNEIRSYGISFSLDDFGTGYSSLSHLQKLPISEIKIDRSFVRNISTNAHDASIVRTITALGKNLGLIVVAEGVETVEQRDFLLSNGCRFWQGYLAGKPQPLVEFERLITQRISH